MAQLPRAITHFGSGIWSYRVAIPGAIFFEMVPATIITSLCLGDGLNTSAPNLERSNRAAPVHIISIAQQAIPNVSGHSEFALQRLISLSAAANWTNDDGTFSKDGGMFCAPT